jgi:PAS domain S-box-containing protein
MVKTCDSTTDVAIQDEVAATERRARQYFENIINNVPSYIFWKDRNSRYLGCNRLFAKAAGFDSPEEIIGKSDYDMPWLKTESDAYVADDRKIIESGEAKLNIEETQTLQDGTQITVLTNKVPFFDDNNNIMGILAVYTDITQLRQMQKLRIENERIEAANLAKTRFIANMSHDIRTPLSGVIGMAKILESEGDTRKDREYAHIIHTTSKRLLFLLNDILEGVSVDEIREEALKLETFSLAARVANLEKLIISNFKLACLKFKTDLDANLPAYVVGDRIKIDRILLNLVSNALKFTEQGQVAVSVRLKSKEKQNIIVELRVSDTGVGIDEREVHKIFDRFYRIDTSENMSGGHGIGLYLVHKYVSLLDGNISVASEVGKGTTFIVTLPFVIDENMASQHDMAGESSTQIEVIPGSINLKALLIEDDKVARWVANNILEAAGVEVEIVDTAEEGFKRVMDKSYDLIITDIALPGMNGDQFAELMRFWERMTNHDRTPIIGLSAYSKQHRLAKFAGMDEFLEKPLDQPKVKRIMDRYFVKQTEKHLNQKNNQGSESKLGPDLPDTEKELFLLDQYPLFDEEDAIEKLAGNRELLIDILKLLVYQVIPQDLEYLKKAYDKLDWSFIQKTAHKLKGSAMYCGTTRMRYACQYLERYKLAGHSKALEELYQQLMAVLKETQRFVAYWLTTRSCV